MEKTFSYYAFISYKREDKKWAKWLQHKLEYYKLPVTLKKQNPSLPNKIRPIFRDTTDLEPGFLTEKIKDALNASKFLIVICSPNAAKSVWVNKEVEMFIKSGRTDKIIPFIIEGTPNAQQPEKECFPPLLRKASIGKDILGANIHEMGRDAASIKVISSMFNIRFDELWQRYKRDKTRQQLYIIAAAILAFLAAICIGFLYIDRNRANMALQQTNLKLNRANNALQETNQKLETVNISIEKERIRLLAKNASELVEKGEILPALRMAVQWLPSTDNNRPFVPEMMSVLNKAMNLLSDKEFKMVDKVYDEKASVSPDGRWGAYTYQGEFYLYDYHKQTSHRLEGHDMTDEYDFKFSTDSKIVYGRGAYMWMAWETDSKKRLNPSHLTYINKGTCEEIENAVIPGTYQYTPNSDSVKYLPTGTERCINGKLLSSRYVKLYKPAYRILPNIPQVKHTEKKKTIRYDKQTWQEIDRKENIRLYKPKNQDEMDFDTKILWHNVKSGVYKSFTPFLPYSLGNGIAYLFTAYIADSTHVLCVAGQDSHLMLDVTSDERRYFEYYNINTMYSFEYDFAHIDTYLAAAQLFNNGQNLFTISRSGAVSIFDVPSGCLVKEFVIPYKNEEKFKQHDYYVDSAFINPAGTEITVTITESSSKKPKVYYVACDVPDERTLVDYAINALDNFWN